MAYALQRGGWLGRLRTRGMWEFLPGARGGAYGSGDRLIEFRAQLAAHPELDGLLAMESAASLLGLAQRLPEDLAGRKVVALFGRAEARDFADVHALSARYDQARLLELAAEVDRGFDLGVFADMLGPHARFSDDEIPVAFDDVAALREFCDAWADALRTQPRT